MQANDQAGQPSADDKREDQQEQAPAEQRRAAHIYPPGRGCPEAAA